MMKWVFLVHGFEFFLCFWVFDGLEVVFVTLAMLYDNVQANQPPDQHSDMAPFSESPPHPGNP